MTDLRNSPSHGSFCSESARAGLMPHGSPGNRGFTLTELMIAVAILIVVIIATSKIFGTASKITGIGQANADVLQEAAAIQRLLQDDINRITKEGFLGIRCVAVPNDINVPDSGPLLNPLLAADATIRADQLVFFRNGLAGIQTSRVSGGIHHRGQGTTAMIYYGHGFQLPDGLATQVISGSTRRTHDPQGPVTAPYSVNDPILPWYRGDIQMVRTLFKTVSGTGAATDIFSSIPDDTINGTQPEARQWLLCRQQIALMDDDKKNPNTNSKTVYLFRNATARSVFFEDPGPPAFSSHEIRNGRLDAAASRLNDIRDRITTGFASAPFSKVFSEQADAWIGNRPTNPGPGRRDLILNQIMLYPRAERVAPSMDRTDQALTNHVLASACSSFRIEWTYAQNTGQAFGERSNGTIYVPWVYEGFRYGPGFGNGPGPFELEPIEQPWFGWFDQERGVFPYRTPVDWGGSFPPQWTGQDYPWWSPAFTVGWDIPSNSFDLDLLELFDDPFLPDPPVKQYAAIFGFNSDTPLIENVDGKLVPDLNLIYTPWPTALRITMTLHDPKLNLEKGREIQFIINLPKRSD